ncbi:TonB-dependent receptor plug domain-containing protein [Sphingobacterium phlebotomi]|uniref:TonB-dependent receptor plug domain-containing protein n=1 Tax=Sphingobacterium phlebotomi TaxID=2605433 RepID=A0A5D4HF83_9SPHI|nr:M56 family metallopeptidase [Sphingobacterium phlebotomi]TYR38255.1 TonB-dependent receptor plug domain-containing protein [Sphingobacterium phlebotomi]
MDSLLAYTIQVNILLAIVYIGYYALLKKLTFYRLNRIYFLTGIVFAFVYPFLDIKSLFRRHIEPVGEWMGYLPDFYTQQVEGSVYTLEHAIYSGIAIVGLCLAVRLCIQLLSLLRIHIYSRKAVWKTYWYQDVLFPIVPFSFLNKIYLHKEQHQEPELCDIFEHEDIHVKGLHSLDILIFEVLLIVCWYNPFVWFMRRAVRQNLEYLTDQQVLNKGVDRQTYQYSLLQVSKQGASLGVSNQFNFKFLKKRIMMMNKKKSSKLQLSKYAFLLPVMIFSAGAFTISKADGKITEAVQVAREMEVEEIKGLLQKQGTVKPTFGMKSEETTLPAAKDDQTKGSGFLLDGKLVEQKVVEQLDVRNIESVVVNIDNNLTEQHGLKSLLNIKTKEYAGTVGTPSRIKAIRFNEDGQMTIEGPMSGVARSGKKQDLSIDKVSFVADSGRNSTKGSVKSLGKNPIYIVDGKRTVLGFSVGELKSEDIHSLEVLKGFAAIDEYGEDGRDGVIKVTTKKWAKENPDEVKDISKMKDVAVVGYSSKNRQDTVKILKGSDAHDFSGKAVEGKVTGVRVNRKQNLSDTTKRSNIVFRNSKMGGKPLFVIDGVAQPEDTTIDKLNPDQIESIDVLKDESAVAKYGDKGKNGVIMITTKTSAKARQREGGDRYTDDDVFFVDGKAVSKNEFTAVPENKIIVKDIREKTGEKGREIEIKTRKWTIK